MVSAIVTAQVLGISSAAWVSGEIFVYGYAGVPVVRQCIATNPKLASQLWDRLFSIGCVVGPSVGTIATASFIYLRTQTGIAAYTYAAAFTFGLFPWSMLAMQKTNNTIFDITGTAGKAEKDPTALDNALKTWSRLNYVRSSLPFIGAMIGFYGSLSN